ncbi:CatB-related O-acetyltransferase [Desulforhopalus singaporensis]|uniref:Acetyltransferase (Isoleucine patch superfamily) n=1 Tax=Desulforhopalus singaporensis TaxID=91360 RepID=A0A1H0UXE6_9BACT|nr:CatB-related O-acetyltransferase [Desulforhopalus singaporensis]SDP70840.1 Acetyltransferase (isoleucine patch superfamily) [Desulforhopalus singaporensis]
MASGINSIVKIINPVMLKAMYIRRCQYKKFSEPTLGLGLHSSFIDTKIGKYNYFGSNVQLKNVNIDSHSYINSNTKLQHCTIGKFCSIGSNVQISLGEHPTNLISTHPAFYSNKKKFKCFADKTYIEEYKKVEIGHDVWVGEGVTVLGGLKIGHGAIIGARALVTKNVPPYTIVGGVPAKIIRKRFSEDKIDLLLQFEWWNMPEDWFHENWKCLLENDFSILKT